MKVLPDTIHILTLCDLYCAVVNRSEVRVADLAVGNPYFFKRLRAGARCTVKTYGRALQWFSDHWPADLAWPTDIPRPAPSAESAAREAASGKEAA